MLEEKKRSRGLRIAKRQCKFEEIKNEIIKTEKTRKGTKKSKIIEILSCTPQFAGCYAENQLSELTITSFPCSLIVNLDHEKLPGSHWVALFITKQSIEIWDTLGFRILDWPRIPCTLLKFLHRQLLSRRIIVSKRIQSSESVLCGFYCIFFIICRPYLSFNALSETFSTKLSLNDKLLLKFFS